MLAVSALGACTYNFDAPFGQSSEGGGTTATTSQGSGGAPTTTSGSTTGTTTGSTTGTTTSSTGDTTSTTSTGPDPITLDCDGDCTFVPGNGGCCWDETNNHGAPQAECLTSAPNGNDCRTQPSSNGLESLIACQRPEDCEGGQVCCAVWEVAQDGTVYFPSVGCVSSCSSPSVTLCEDGGAVCELDLECAPVAGLPEGYFGCGP